jgi:drug/metabolite transporter (DMT)-like permease
MQFSNACFAVGQVVYRRLSRQLARPDWQLIGPMYLGAALIAGLAAALTFTPATLTSLSPVQWLVLLYLGLIASGIGFFLFNAGARRADVGALAIFNNVKVPLAVLTSILLFGDPANWPRLVLGGALIALALAVNELSRSNC